jgi:myo-inositol-1(or 4)-monophosphatase
VREAPIEVASRLAREAGALIAGALGNADTEVERKSTVDLVTATDRASERLIVDGLRRHFPGHDIVAEESAPKRPAAGRYCWCVDPLDGTTNFVHGLPHCSVSLALLAPDGDVETAVVFDPFRQEMFDAQRGAGARLNGRGMRVSSTSRLDDALFVTGFPYDRRERTSFYLAYFEMFLKHARDVRRFGSAALDLSYVAAGRFDGFWEWQLKPWDTAAGWLIVRESGGRVTDFDGSSYDPWGPRIVATNGRVHGEAVDLLSRVSARNR